jgi:DNA-binding beta-propeller fold protein YncE/mono/diheme cytochrome c family protein
MLTQHRLLLSLLLFTTALTSPASSHAQTRSAGLLNFNADGSLFACSNRDSGTVSIVSWPALKLLHEIPVGLHPEGVAWIGNSNSLACCVYGTDEIVILDASAGSITRKVPVFDEPYGIVSSADGTQLFATLEYPGQILAINPADGTIRSTWQVGSMLRGLALSPDQTFLLTTEYLTSRVLRISTADGSIRQTWEPASTDNLSRQIVIAPAADRAWFTHIRSRVTAAHGNGSIFPYVSVARLNGPDAGTRLRIPLDTIRGTRVTANPWDCDITPDGRTLCVAFAGTNDMYLLNVTDNHSELDFKAALQLGSNPRAVRCSPDGSAVLTYNALDFSVIAFSLADGRELGRLAVTESPLSEQLLLGKKLFYTALSPMTSRGWISCSSCHPDGDADGRTWQQPEGLRNTQPMNGLAWTHPLHWSSDRDEVQDFEHTIRGKLMQGRGLLQGTLPDAMAEPIAGRSKALDALAAWTNSHNFTLSPHAKHGLNEAAQRGQLIFHSEKTGCATCHKGPLYSDSQPGPADQLTLHNVGTGNDDPSELMGPRYDTPTLLGIYRSAPYLHHGRAATLHDVLTTANTNDQHGKTSHLSTAEINDLVEFLKSLPFELPEPQARAAGLQKISAAP